MIVKEWGHQTIFTVAFLFAFSLVSFYWSGERKQKEFGKEKVIGFTKPSFI